MSQKISKGFFKLLSDTPITESLEVVIEEKNKEAPMSLYVQGPYMVAGEINKNRRKYILEEMSNEVTRFTDELIKTNRALGELEHSNTPSINSERACHLIKELKQDGNVFIGKSKILSTPMGMIAKSLIDDGVRMGMSTRALGQIIEEGSDVSLVKNFKLVTVDLVADPSAPGAFVNGILESKNFVLKENGKVEEVYELFESAISSIPKKDKEEYLKKVISEFINNLTIKI